MMAKSGVICLVVTAVLTVSSAQDTHPKQPAKRSYVCPPDFIRLSHRCYFFSKEKATWQESYYQCQSMHSNLAIVKNANQDKVIRKILSRKRLDPHERWLGGRFDWQQKRWKWAASGKPVFYKGFDPSVDQDQEKLQWNCIIVDPNLQYRWNTRSCLEEKHFICHKKIQTISNNKSRKKLLQQYNTNRLNEIPVPDISTNLLHNSTNLKAHQKVLPASSLSNLFQIEVNPELDAQYAYQKKERKNKKRKRNHPVPLLRQFANGTVYQNDGQILAGQKQQNFRRRRNKVKEDENNAQSPIKIYYKTYKESSHSKDPLRPKPIVEEYNFAKEG